MSDIELYKRTNHAIDRRTSRSVNRQRAGALVRTAGVDTETDLAIVKIENFTMVVGAGMASVARVAQMQRQLEQQAPEATGHLAFLADSHLMGVDAQLADLRCRLRRW